MFISNIYRDLFSSNGSDHLSSSNNVSVDNEYENVVPAGLDASFDSSASTSSKDDHDTDNEDVRPPRRRHFSLRGNLGKIVFGIALLSLLPASIITPPDTTSFESSTTKRLPSLLGGIHHYSNTVGHHSATEVPKVTIGNENSVIQPSIVSVSSEKRQAGGTLLEPTYKKLKPRIPSKKKGDTGGILYLAELDLPPLFLEQIKLVNFPLWLDLTGTKVGQTKDTAHLDAKMVNLQTYHSFSTLKYVAIEHTLDPYDVEQAMHFVFMIYHMSGEWYDLDIGDKANILRRLIPRHTRIFRGVTTFPGQVDTNNLPECKGNVYLASYSGFLCSAMEGMVLITLKVMGRLPFPLPFAFS